MIAQLKGQVAEVSLEKEMFRVVLDVQGVGYEVFLPKASEFQLIVGKPATLYVSESVTAFDGATTLYGFVTRQEKEFFVRIRENVDGMGPKKAMECMDKISKSLPDFKRAVLDSDVSLLISVFGFTKKTAEKLVFSLKEKVAAWPVTGPVKWAEAAKTNEEAEAVSGLVNLGYREDEARDLVAQAKAALGETATTEILLQEALRQMGNRS